MYLSKVNLSDNNKLHYLDLVTLLITAEPRNGSNKKLLEQLKPSEKSNTLSIFEIDRVDGIEDDWFVPSDEELEALKVCMFELGDFKGSLGNIANTMAGRIAMRNPTLRSRVDIDSQDVNYQILWYSFSKCNYMSSMKSLINEAASNPEYKKQVLMKFIDLGIEISEIDQKKSNQVLVQFPEVRIQLINYILEKIFENSQFDQLSLTERKILIFELVALAHADGNVHELEEVVINTVADKFQIDEETLEELKDAAQNVITAVNDAAEIIFE